MTELAGNQQDLNPNAQNCLQELLRIWFDFERQLNRVPLIRRLENGQFNRKDYQNLLLHLRQQVIEGSRWISRCASSFDRDYSDVRSSIIQHAADEHRDYRMLESDYLSCGGELTDIQNAERNIGSEALHAFLMYRASQLNPYELLGAMWIIEGLGEKMASNWAGRIQELCQDGNLRCDFMRYHSENDENHMEKLYTLLDRVCVSEQNASRICKTARVVARLYCLQLEEIL